VKCPRDDFDITNPNKVRSLIGHFAANNPVNFHAEDSTGYKLLADTIITLNDVNPAIAARMCAPFLQWKRYDSATQTRIKCQLDRIIALPNLKTAISELIGKALAQ
jgi:aminopeptidase N